MRVAKIEAYLTHLAVDQHVAASTQNQALSALLFLYREVLHKGLDGPIDAVRAKRPKRLPTVLTKPISPFHGEICYTQMAKATNSCAR